MNERELANVLNLPPTAAASEGGDVAVAVYGEILTDFLKVNILKKDWRIFAILIINHNNKSK